MLTAEIERTKERIRQHHKLEEAHAMAARTFRYLMGHGVLTEWPEEAE